MRVKHLIAVLAMVAAGTAGAYELDKFQRQTTDCRVFVDVLQRASAWRLQGENKDKIFRSFYDGQNKIRRETFRPYSLQRKQPDWTQKDEAYFRRVLTVAMDIVFKEPMQRLDVLGHGIDCEKYPDYLVQWEPITK
jgi:hypothetical protein